jgi:hypothetical protein
MAAIAEDVEVVGDVDLRRFDLRSLLRLGQWTGKSMPRRRSRIPARASWRTKTCLADGAAVMATLIMTAKLNKVDS